MKRRSFIKTSAIATAGILLLPEISAAKKKNNIGLQLYTLRDSVPKDPKGVLKKVASFGYKDLETYAYGDGKIYGMPFNEFGTYVKSLGMRVCSGHYSLGQIRGDKWEQAVTDAKAVGQEYMVMPYIEEKDRKTIDNYKSICESLNKAGEVCNKHGIRFQYHNHAFEFDTVDGQIPYDLMLKELDTDKVGMELDLYWVVRAGRDPLKMFEQYPGRFEQWHVKDMDKSNKDRNADIGTGSIDFKPIFARAKQSGMKNFYVEQETYPGDPIDSVAASIRYLKTIL